MAHKKVTVDVAAIEETEEVMQPKRSTRKRNVVSYAELEDGNYDWDNEEEVVKKPTKKTKATTARAATTATTTTFTPTEASDSAFQNKEESEELEKSPSLVKEKKRKTTKVANTATTAIAEKPAAAALPRKKPEARRRKARDDEPEYAGDAVEVRKRPYLDSPPTNFGPKIIRAISERIAIVDRQRSGTDAAPQEKFQMMGSTGQSYMVTITYIPKCTCPDFLFRKAICKHIIYVLHYALKVPQDSEVLYQTALTTAELQQLLNETTTTPIAAPEDLYRDGKRKHIEGECPICYMDFDPAKEQIDYCKAACGNNVHHTCMRTWISAQTGSYGKATCPYCRNPWIS